jgi:hypothetical protein
MSTRADPLFSHSARDALEGKAHVSPSMAGGQARLIMAMLLLLSVVGPLPALAASPSPTATASASGNASPTPPTSAQRAVTPGPRTTLVKGGQTSGGVTPLAGSSGTVILPRGSTWQYSYDDVTWSTGQTPIGDPATPNLCGANRPTDWNPSYATIYLKTTLPLSGSLTGGQVSIDVDDDAQVTINGTVVAPLTGGSECATYWNRVVGIPDNLLTTGTNTIEVQATNYVCCDREIDLEITGTVAPSADAAFGECVPTGTTR